MPLAALVTAAFAVELQAVSKVFLSESGGEVHALQDLTLSVKENTFVSVIGPSGCGKSTLLKLVAGLEKPTSGSIVKSGTGVSRIHDQAIVFQQYNLFPWLTVEKNIEFGLIAKQLQEQERRPIVSQLLRAMGLGDFARSFPKELSGGMQQRVGLARALATNPRLLLMDEPFTALDLEIRRVMQELLLRMWVEEPRTVIFTSHDVDEVILMSDVIHVMTARPGRLARTISVDFPRPRPHDIEFTHAFVEMKMEIQEIMTRESMRGMEAHQGSGEVPLSWPR